MLPAGDWQVVVRDIPDPHFDAYSPWATDGDNGGFAWRWVLYVSVPEIGWATDEYWIPNGGDVVYFHTAQEALAANLGQPPLHLPHLDFPATVWFWCGDYMNEDNRGGASVFVEPAGGSQSGACCSDSFCTLTTPAECSGTWQGVGTTCTPNPCSPLLEGLIANWCFDNCTASDCTGHGYNGTNYGAACVPGVTGNAFEFVDHGMVWQIPEAFDDTVVTTQALTLALWVYRYSNVPTPSGVVFDGRAQGADAGFEMTMSPDGHLTFFVIWAWHNVQRIDSVSAASPDQWTHVAAEFDYAAGVLRLFINGEEDAASPAPVTKPYFDDYSNAAIGNNHWAPGDGQWGPFYGRIDEVRFYDRVLTPAEIQELAGAEQGPSNDECSGAITVTTGVAVNGDTTLATGSQAGSCPTAGRNLWYKWTADCSATATVSLCGSAFDTVLYVLNACGGSVVACNDDS